MIIIGTANIKLDKNTLKVADQYAAYLNKLSPDKPQHVSSKNYALANEAEKNKTLICITLKILQI